MENAALKLIPTLAIALLFACDNTGPAVPIAEQTIPPPDTSKQTVIEPDPIAEEGTEEERKDTIKEVFPQAVIDDVLADAEERKTFNSNSLKKLARKYELDKAKDVSDEELERIPAEELSKLDASDAIGYALFYPEAFYQNCDMPPGPDITERYYQYWLSYDTYSDGSPSDRQMARIRKDSLAASELFSRQIRKAKEVSDPLLFIVSLTSHYELVPDLLDRYERGGFKDHRLMYLVLDWMRGEKFGPLARSGLVGDPKESLEHDWWPEIRITVASRTQLITFARQFHAEQAAKKAS